MRINTFVNGLILSGVLMVSTMGFLIAGPYLEGTLFPVIINVQFTQVESPKNAVSLQVTGNKIRPCRFIEANAITRTDGTYEKGDISFSTDSGNPTRPLGQQDFGVWTVVPKGDKIRFEIRHSCHGLWETRTSLGEWPK